MGNSSSSSSSFNVFIIGFNNSGKKCILNKIGARNVTPTIPAIDLITYWEYKNIKFTMLMDFNKKSMDLYKHYLIDNIVMFIFDCSQVDSFNEIKSIIHLFDKNKENINPFIIIANKQDIGIIETDKIKELLDLDKLTSNRKYEFIHCSAKTGEGISLIINTISNMNIN